MVTLPSEREGKPLPTRVRAKRDARNGLAIRLALADRIAALPGIEAVDANPGAVPHSVDVWLRPQSASIRRQPDPVRLCTISQDGVVVYGLGDGDRYRILSRGWGRLRHHSVCVFLPRDDEELEVCWEIVERAYRSMQDASEVVVRPKLAPHRELPRFSRTTLQ
jgi:hypothetical protein